MLVGFLIPLTLGWLPTTPVPPSPGVAVRARPLVANTATTSSIPPPAVNSKNGVDPRPNLSPNELVPDTEWAASITPGTIGKLSNVNQLQAALDTAAASSGFVVLKFEREDCVACATTRELYADAAVDGREGGLFFSVDCFKSGKLFARDHCKVKVVPSVMLFADGQLHTSMRLSGKDWKAFDQLLRALSPSYKPPNFVGRAWRSLRRG